MVLDSTFVVTQFIDPWHYTRLWGDESEEVKQYLARESGYDIGQPYYILKVSRSREPSENITICISCSGGGLVAIAGKVK